MKTEKLKNRYFNSIDFEAIETTNKLLKELEKEEGFELMVAEKFNAIYLRDESKKINDCIASWFGYTLNGYYVYFQFDYFWLFEGTSVSAYPIENGTYKNNKYSLNFKEPVENFNELLELLKNPKKINDRQTPIYARSKSDMEYVSRSRKIETKIYY